MVYHVIEYCSEQNSGKRHCQGIKDVCEENYGADREIKEDDLILGSVSTAHNSKSPTAKSTTAWRHLECVSDRMLVKIKDMPRHIKGWENLTEEDQTMITNRQKAAKAKQQENKAKRKKKDADADADQDEEEEEEGESEGAQKKAKRGGAKKK